MEVGKLNSWKVAWYDKCYIPYFNCTFVSCYGNEDERSFIQPHRMKDNWEYLRTRKIRIALKLWRELKQDIGIYEKKENHEIIRIDSLNNIFKNVEYIWIGGVKAYRKEYWKEFAEILHKINKMQVSKLRQIDIKCDFTSYKVVNDESPGVNWCQSIIAEQNWKLNGKTTFIDNYTWIVTKK